MAERKPSRFAPSARLTPANLITVARILATVPVVVLIARLGVSWWSAGAWLAASSTDFVDGWVARRQGATTSGAFLDPLADKVLVLAALATLASQGRVLWLPVGLIAVREALVSLYRSMVARDGVSVPARRLAKLKTASQDGAVGFLLLPLTGHSHPWVGQSLLWVAVGLALVSGAQYMLDARRRPSLVVEPALPTDRRAA